MASGGEAQPKSRQRRAWRKPREAVGSENEERMNTVTQAALEPASRSDPIKPCPEYPSKQEEQMELFSASSGHAKPTSQPGQAEPAFLPRVRPDARPFEIDGSVMEGGGQIIRMAIALSSLQLVPISLVKVRAGRANPGLRPQHVSGIRLLREITRGRLEGDSEGSPRVIFFPGPIHGGTYEADTRTAGSICLLLQVALPCLVFAPQQTDLQLKGGTNADMAPTIDYYVKVFKPVIEKFGVSFDCVTLRKGFHPRGGGEVNVLVQPVDRLSPVVMTEKGRLAEVTVEVFRAGTTHPRVCDTMLRSAQQVLRRRLGPIAIASKILDLAAYEAFANGSGITIVAKTTTGCLLGGSANGRKNIPPEVTGRNAAEELLKNLDSGGCVDEHLQDQLVIWMALADGVSEVRTGPVTLHTETAIHVAQLLTQAKFDITQDGETWLVKCTGIGHRARPL